MPQWQLTFTCSVGNLDAYCSLLESQAISICGYEKSDDLYVVEAIFDHQHDFSISFELLATQLHTVPPQLHWTLLADTNWLEKNWYHFPPVQRGKYYIYGSHVKDPIPKGFIGLEINAATAFGSGEHETTQGCLQAIESLDPKCLKNALDLGCGSGILALALAKTFSIPVVASDNDPEAIRVTQYNTHLNHCEHLITTVISEGFENPILSEQAPYSLTVANIFAGPLCDLAPAIVKNLFPYGTIILSGFYDWQASDIIKTYTELGLTQYKVSTLNKWATVMFTL